MGYKKRNNNIEAPVEEVEEVVEAPVEEVEEVVEAPVEEVEEVIEAPVEEIQNEKYLKVVPMRLNVREQPSKDSKVVTVVKNSQLVQLIEPEVIDGFYHIDTLTGFTGYCMEQFVEEA